MFEDGKSLMRGFAFAEGGETYENLHSQLYRAVIILEGYYNALGRIAKKTNLNGVNHLGDHIYEGTERKFDKDNNPPFDKFEATHFINR